MERINNSNTQYTQDAKLLIGPREPYNKNTLWIQREGNEFNIKLFDKKWKILSSTKDQGLSPNSEKQVKDMIDEIKNLFIYNLEKFKSLNSLQEKKYLNKINQQNKEIEILKKQVEDVTKKYNYLQLKLKNENRK